jgi:glycosyltransferase involved in cell wall biosynthesis
VSNEALIVGGPAEADVTKNDNYVKLARFAARLGVADRVIFTGRVGYAALPPLLRSADLVVGTGMTGIIVRPDRAALLAHPMLMEAYGVAAADRVRSRYSWDRIAGETIAVYDRVMARAA